MTVPDNIRQELIRLCSREATRRAEFTRKAPIKWHPEHARNPTTGEPYTKNGAWERVHSELKAGCDINTVALDKPPGKTGYAFSFRDGRGVTIYVKLQILSGVVIGRSFHETRFP